MFREHFQHSLRVALRRPVSDEPRGPLVSPGFWLHHAALTWRRAIESRLGDLTYPQFNVLTAVSWLTANGGAPTQQQVADFARTDRMMTSKLVGTLMANGYLKRTTDRIDTRLKRLELTARGRAAVKASGRAARAVDEELFGGPAATLRDALRGIAEQSWRSSGE